MLRHLSWETTDTLARDQLRMFSDLGEAVRIGDSDRPRMLLLNGEQWAEWATFLNDGPLPAEPPLPTMLQRLGRASHHLTVLAERRARVPRA